MQKEIIQAYKTCPKWSDNEMEDNKLAPLKKFSIFLRGAFVKILKSFRIFFEKVFKNLCLRVCEGKRKNFIKLFCPPFRYQENRNLKLLTSFFKEGRAEALLFIFPLLKNNTKQNLKIHKQNKITQSRIAQREKQAKYFYKYFAELILNKSYQAKTESRKYKQKEKMQKINVFLSKNMFVLFFQNSLKTYFASALKSIFKTSYLRGL